MLLQIADARLAGADDLPAVGGHLAGQHPEQGGLAAAVVADQADLIPFPDIKGNARKKRAFSKIFGQCVYGQTGHDGFVPLF